MNGYLVAQVADRVRIVSGGATNGLTGVVVREYPCVAEPSVTARVCDVLLADGVEVRVHADYLRVVEAPDDE